MTQKQEVVTQRHLRRGGLHTGDDIASSFMTPGVCKWKRAGGENNQRDRRADLLHVLAHILISPTPIPALLTQSQRLHSFLSFTLRLWLKEVNKAHSEPFLPKTELDLQVGTLKLTEASRLVLGILLPACKRNYDLKLFTPHRWHAPLHHWEDGSASWSSSQQHGEGTWENPRMYSGAYRLHQNWQFWGIVRTNFGVRGVVIIGLSEN